MSGDIDPIVAARAAAAALEQLPAVVWVFTGPDHVAVVANRAARDYRNGSRSHLLGKSLRTSLTPENRPLIELLDEVYRTGVTRTFYETRIRVDDEDRFVTFTASALRDDQATVIGVISYMIDVTDSLLAKHTAQREHAVLQALQERLLPAGLPVLPQVRVAARYRAAGNELAAGGDWYDAVPLDHGRLAVSVGDVVGHGPGAAAVMGQLRSVLKAALLDRGDAIAALAQLEHFVRTLPPARGSTACVVIFDPATGLLRHATAGHPPPLLIEPNGSAEFLSSAPSAPLGLPGPPASAGVASLPPGAAVLLYSDGVVERPGAPTEQSRQRLRTVCEEAVARGCSPTELVDAVMAGLAGETLPDDVVLLVVSRPATDIAPLLLESPATPSRLTWLRFHLRHWLAQVGVCEDDAIALQIASGEATTNAVEHAYAAVSPGIVTLSAELTVDSTVRICIRDNGRWREPAREAGQRGRGLLLMQQCTDNVHVHRGAEGTVVEMTRRVWATEADTAEADAAEADTAAPTTSDAAHAPSLSVRMVAAERGEVAVLSGDLDAAGIPAAAVTLRTAARGGALPLTVDLTRLQHVTSTGVKLLFDLAAEEISAGNKLTVQVARGSAAHHVLDLTGLAALAVLDFSAAS
ncbi:MAG TPA: SpoIIE family protein phosphatase [Pseudonocardiaceae bacterium]